MKSVFWFLCLAGMLLFSIASAQDTTLTVHVFPQYVGGAPSTTGLEQPVALFVEWAGLEANTAYEQQHVGFLTRGTSTVRGSKWANNNWISPSTKTAFMSTDANGKMKAWVFIRTPSSYIVGVDTALFRFRVNKVGSSVNITKEQGYFISLHVSDTAKGVTAGAVVYGHLDTVAQNNPASSSLCIRTTAIHGRWRHGWFTKARRRRLKRRSTIHVSIHCMSEQDTSSWLSRPIRRSAGSKSEIAAMPFYDMRGARRGSRVAPDRKPT